MKQGRLPMTTGTTPAAPAATATAPAPTVVTAEGKATTVPIPEQNPLAYAAPPVSVESAKKPFWKFWSKD
jgi:hypothetical protein